MSGNTNLFNARDPVEFNTSISFGQVDGFSRVTALGHNPDIDTNSVPEDGWEFGGTFSWLTSAQTLEVVSDSVNDTAAGTGLRKVLVSGLDSNYSPISEVVTMNGTTPVSTANPYLRINGFMTANVTGSVGSNKVNSGDVTLRVAGGGSTQSLIRTGIGFARSSMYTVPAGFTLSVISIVASINRSGVAKAATFSTFFQSPLGFYRMPLELTVYNTNPYRHDGNPGIIVSEKTDFCIRCNYVSADNTDLTAGWLGILRDNNADQ